MTIKLNLNPQLARMLLAGVLAAGVAAPAAADDVFLKLDGIRGESTDDRHRFEIDVLSYTHSLTGAFARGTGSAAAAAGKTICGPVTITKFVDASSPDLILNVANGKHIPKAVFTFRRPSSAKQLEFYKVTLEDVIITEIEQTDNKSGRAAEKVSLIGRRFFFEYTEATASGSPGARPKSGWDCVSASKV
jgi:type VI secretion system secreted protein Hcp